MGASAPNIARTAHDNHSHSVQFYNEDALLLNDLSRFIGSSLGAGEAAVVIATPNHLTGLARRLRQRGFDLDLAIRQGRYVALDAAETLSTFMLDGYPDPTLFREVIGAAIMAAADCVSGDYPRVAAFGEMVALLWAEGKSEAALKLEQLWNDLGMTHPFYLRCAYPLGLFPHSTDANPLEQVCSLHSHVIPTEGYTTLRTEDERLLAIALLQQKAQALETEIEEHIKARRALHSAIEARDAFLSVAAHELKTPITSLRGFAQLLLRSVRANRNISTDRLETALTSIELQTGKLARLISRLLDTTQIEAGKLRLDLEPTDVVPIIRALLEQQSDPDHTFLYEGPDQLQLRVDPIRFEQVITNLLTNAVKFSPQGGPVIVRLEKNGSDAIDISVTDHGLGIPADRREAAFDRFYQAHSESESERHLAGMGLGLHITREIVQLHGGSIRIEEPEHAGSRFVVSLPTLTGGS
jgi:signal transduction histidine kinase